MVAYKSSPLNLKIAHEYVTALGALMSTGAPRELSNPREAALIAVPEGKEPGLHERGYTRERDVIAIAFRPGRENKGPCNIAIYEQTLNGMRITPRCSPWYRGDPKLFMIAAHDDEIGFGYGDARLVRYGPVPREQFARRLKEGKVELQRAAKVARGLPSLFTPY